jgi:hypothetical protein
MAGPEHRADRLTQARALLDTPAASHIPGQTTIPDLPEKEPTVTGRPLNPGEINATFDAIENARLAREERELRREEANHRHGCPQHGHGCDPDDHIEPPTVNGEVL